MNEISSPAVTPKSDSGDILKSWMMVILTLVFISLYAAALLGWLRPLSDITMVTRLEPIIFVIIGYYFGRLPAQHTEKSLKGEINRQTQKADAAGHANVQALLERESLEEKIKNTRIVLTSSPHLNLSFAPEPERGSDNLKAAKGISPSADLISAAVGVLDS